jgi:hypothetical protein
MGSCLAILIADFLSPVEEIVLEERRPLITKLIWLFTNY